MNKFSEYAVIDLGSNSFHMVIARYVNGAIQVIYRYKQNVRLAMGLNEEFELSQTSIEKGIHCLSLFAERLKGFPVKHVRVIATHTLRVAKNKHQFIQAAKQVFPYPIEIISGQEEARLIYLGMITAESTKESDVKFVIDIGGGSTEIAIGTGFKPTFIESKPMGSITYTSKFFPQNKIDKIKFNSAKLAAQQQIENIVEAVKRQNISVAFGTSGTIKNIHTILLDLGVTDGIITAKRLKDLTSYILEFKHFDEIDYPSLSEDRKLVFVSGLAIFCGVFDALGLQELRYSPNALREGVLYELIDGHNHFNIRQNTAESLSIQYNIDEQHANRVVRTTQYFFEQWRQQASTVISSDLESILYWAAQLHEVGLNINFSSIHKHSSYILQNSNLPGFNQEQQLLLATLVHYHRKSINLTHFPYFSLFEYASICPLLQILRLAVLINNQRTENLDLKAFHLYLDNPKSSTVILDIAPHFVENNRLILLDLQQEQTYWKSVNHWQLIIKVGDKHYR